MADNKKLIVIVSLPGTRLLTLAGPSDVFGLAATYSNNEEYEVMIAAATVSRQVHTNSGIDLLTPASVHEIRKKIDTLIIIGYNLPEESEDYKKFYQWLQRRAPQIRRIGSVCVSTFVLAKAGLLHNKRATTHWERYEQLQSMYPDIQVDTTPFFIKDGNIYTSGGVTSGIDLALAMVEEDLGRELALRVARKMVVHLKRPGNQSQFGALLPDYELNSHLLRKLRPWIMDHIDEDLRVEQMADYMNMSARNFARVFLKDTGLTPAKFIEKLRLELARNYLENSDLNIEQIAVKCGLGGLVSMRRVFLRHLEVSPSTYRNSFRTSLALN
ncbi:GlxA family transcriptional regulator [Chitinophaga vietnamensis]|uniref:GlxA family transcriptional regulator n=1 Tax=Chitinophaga vietnamensis TaxID=2593957 RepID=UPI001177AD53|nr:GlxA family transcriptional regulator [Chitinophaga vietnamensis]